MIDPSSMIPQPWSDARTTLHRVWAEAMGGPAWSAALRIAMGEIDLHLVWCEVDADALLAPRGLLFDHDRGVADILARARVWTLAPTELLDCARSLRDLAHAPVGYWGAGAGGRQIAVALGGMPGAGTLPADLAREVSVKIDTARTRVAYLVAVYPHRVASTARIKTPSR